jgi:Na+/proline symporter
VIDVKLAPMDWVVLLIYFGAVAAVGIIAGRKVKDTDQYFLGNRRFGKWLMMGQSFGTGTHAEMPVSLAGAVYGMGASAIWYQWKNLFVTPFYWLIAPMFRRTRRTTTAEVIEDRYGSWMGAIYTVFALCFFTINGASMLKGAAKVISQAAGGRIPVDGIVVVMTVVFILYSFVGGLVATAWTDFLQGFLIITLSFMLIPLGWDVVGGMAGMKQALDPYRFSLSTPRGIGPWFILMLTLNGLVGITAQPHLMAAVGTGKDERACRVGFMYGTFTKRFCTIGWAMVGLMVAAMLARNAFGTRTLADPEEAFGFACRHLLFRGGLGLLIACVLAANMAGCSAFMVDSAALFTRNFYRKWLVRQQTDRHYLMVGRVSGVVMTLISVIYAVFFIQRVLYSFLLTETMATFVGISIVGGVLWTRANRWGALASLVTAFAVNFSWYQIRHQRLDHWDPNVFLAALMAGSVAFVVASILTPAEARPALRSFYARLQSPAAWREELLEPRGSDALNAPTREAAKMGHQLLIPNLFQLRRAAAGYAPLHAYREDIAGFAIGCLLTLVLVALAWLIFHY